MPPLNQKNEKKSGCSGASVAGWALAQGGTLAASPEEDRDVGGLSYTMQHAGVPRHHAEAPPRTGNNQIGCDAELNMSIVFTFNIPL